MADNLDPELIRQMNEEMARFRDVVASTIPTMMNVTQSMGDNTRNINRNAESLTSSVAASREGTLASRANAEATKQESEQKKQARKTYDDASKAVSRLGSTIADGNQNMSKYAGSIGSFGTALSSLLTLIAPEFKLLANVVTGVAATFEFLFSGVAKLNDALISATDDLSKIGAILPTDQFQKMASSALYNSQTFGKLSKVITDLGPSLISLGSTTSQGAEAFAQVASVGDDTFRKFRRLGMTQEQLNSSQAQFIKLQYLSGIQITERMKADGSLKKASLEYTENLIKLAAISGQDLETVQRRQEAVNNDIRLMTESITRQKQIRDLENLIQKEKEPGRQKALQLEKEELEQQEKNIAGMKKLISVLPGEKLRQGLTEILATGGGIGDAAGSLLVAFPDLAEKMKEFGKISDEQKRTVAFLRYLSESGEKAAISFSKVIGYMPDFANELGFTSEQLAQFMAINSKSEEEQEEAYKNLVKSIEDAAKAGKDLPKDNQAQAESNARAMALMRDNLVTTIQGPVTKALMFFQETLTSVAKGLYNTFGKMLNLPDLGDKFSTTEDLLKEQEKQKKLLAEINQGMELHKKLGKENLVEYAKQKLPKVQERLEQLASELSTRIDYPQKLDELQRAAAPPAGGKKSAATSAPKVSSQPGAPATEVSTGGFMTSITNAGEALGKMGSFGGQPGTSSGLFGSTLTPKSSTRSILFGDKYATDQSPSEKQLLDYISKFESRKDSYNAIYGGRVEGLTRMTLRQAKDAQKKARFTSGNTGALGRYQFMPDTLADAMAATGVTDDDIFDEATQDKLGTYLLMRRGFADWKSKKITTDEYADKLSAEWAALPFNDGGLYPAHRGTNNSVGVARDKFMEFLQTGKPGARFGGIAQGSESGFPIMLHGNELIKPLDPNSILEKLATTSADSLDRSTNAEKITITEDQAAQVLSQMKDMQADFYNMMLSKLDNMIYGINTGNDIQDRILRHSMI